jgi:hypothetical protein
LIRPNTNLPLSLNLITLSTNSISLKLGDIIDAEVYNIVNSEKIILNLKSPNLKKIQITASINSDLSLSKGDLLKLKVVALGEEIRLQVTEMAKKIEENPLLKSIEGYLAKIGSQIKEVDTKSFIDFFKRIPQDLKIQFPELLNIEKALPKIEEFSFRLVETSIKNSGIFFEGRIRLFSENDIELKKVFDSDIKGLLLKLKVLLSDRSFTEFMGGSGINKTEMVRALDSFLKIIEFYQLSSLLNNVLYSYLPVHWNELKDGQIVFKKREDESYQCQLSILLEDLGKVNVSISYLNKSVYVSFYSDNSYFLSLIDANKEELKKRFDVNGIALKAINIIEKKELNLNLKDKDGLNLKV